MRIRFARKWDLPAIKEIYEEAFPERERKDVELLLSPRYETWLADEKGVILGLAAIVKADGAALLDYLAVKRTERGRGVGDKLLSEVLKAYQPMKEFFLEIETLGLGVDEVDNAVRARRREFYRRYGFKEAGLEVELNGVNMTVLSTGRLKEAENAYLNIYRESFKNLIGDRYRAEVVKRYPPE